MIRRLLPFSLWRIGRRRCGPRTVVITLCAVYFTSMYIFQAGLDTDPQAQRRLINADGDAAHWGHVGADVVDTRSDRKSRGIDQQEAFDNIRNDVQEQNGEKRNSRLIFDRSPDDKPRKWRVQVPDAVDTEGLPPSCKPKSSRSRAPQRDEFKFIEVGGDVMMFSAFWDERENDFDNADAGKIVRIMSLVRGRARPEISCLWTGDGSYKAYLEADTEGVVATNVAYYEMCENHGRPYGSYVVSCRVPDHVINPPCHVTVMTNDRTTYRVPIRTLKPATERRESSQFTVCVPPLFGSVSPVRLVEFIELTFELGADRIVLYQYDTRDPVNRILSNFSSAGCRSTNSQRQCRVDVIPWRISQQIDGGIWYHGQSLAIQDCLYRHMVNSRYVMFSDIDEFLVPHGTNMSTWSDVVDRLLDKPDRCALQVRSAFYDPGPEGGAVDLPDDWAKQILAGQFSLPPLLTMSAVKRSAEYSQIRTKCLVRPYEIFEAGIHHISKPIWANLEVFRVGPEHAFLHHYRNCVGNMGMNCYGTFEDTTMLRYREKVEKSIMETWQGLATQFY